MTSFAELGWDLEAEVTAVPRSRDWHHNHALLHETSHHRVAAPQSRTELEPYEVILLELVRGNQHKKRRSCTTKRFLMLLCLLEAIALVYLLSRTRVGLRQLT
jgi:hypothetical protein